MFLNKLLNRTSQASLAANTSSLLRPAAGMFTPETRFGLRIRVSREINYAFENERK